MGDVRGEIELDGKVLVIKRIHVTYSGLIFAEDDREKIQRVLGVHAESCPVARSLRAAIDITTSIEGL